MQILGQLDWLFYLKKKGSLSLSIYIHQKQIQTVALILKTLIMNFGLFRFPNFSGRHWQMCYVLPIHT